MNQVININGQEITHIFYNGEAVVMMPMVDELYSRTKLSAKRNFRENRDQFVIGEDYFRIPYEEWKDILVGRNSSHQDTSSTIENHGGHRGEMIFLTQTGYLLL